MADDRIYPAVVFHDDGGACLLSALPDGADKASVVEAARSYTSLLHEVLLQLISIPQFRHVVLLQSEQPLEVEGVKMPLAVACGYVELGDKDQTVKVGDLLHPLDIEKLLTTGISALPAGLQGMVSMTAEPVPGQAAPPAGGAGEAEEMLTESVLEITDAKLRSQVDRLNKAAKLKERYDAALSEEAEGELMEALEARMAAEHEAAGDGSGAAKQPLQLGEVVELLAAYMTMVGGVSPEAPNLLQRGLSALQAAAGLPQRLRRRIFNTSRLHHAFLRLEEFAHSGAKTAVQVATKAVRPVLIALVLRRALQTLEHSRDLDMRTSKQPPEKQVEYYYSRLLGSDWREQFAQDMADAIKDVDEGLVTDEIKHEKRKVQASLLRRLEVEEWDKERMKHFYYSQYGLGPWYAEMDEKLTNPYFMGARAWNGGVDNWVGENTTFPNDIPAHQISNVEHAIHMLEQTRGPLSARQKAALRLSECRRVVDQVQLTPEVTGGLVDLDQVARHLAQQ